MSSKLYFAIKHTGIGQRELEEVSRTALKQPHSHALLHTRSSFLMSRVLNQMPNNNTPPQFDPIPPSVTFVENSVGPLLNVSATDSDMGANGEIDYSLSVPDSSPFSIDSVTGQISVDQPLDREAEDGYDFLVIATDRGTPPLTDSAQIVVEVTDVNDNDPQFAENGYEVDVTENAPPTPLLQILANDDDNGLNGVISFSILAGGDCSSSPPPSSCLFLIDANGIVENIVPLDFEAASQHVLTVVATDNGTPPRSNTITVVVNVVNVDEAPPTFLGPCDALLTETEVTGLIVTRCPAEDSDFVPNANNAGTISYNIISGNERNTFTVDGNGTIRNNLPLEKESMYTLELAVTDGAGLSSIIEVTQYNFTDEMF